MSKAPQYTDGYEQYQDEQPQYQEFTPVSQDMQPAQQARWAQPNQNRQPQQEAVRMQSPVVVEPTTTKNQVTDNDLEYGYEDISIPNIQVMNQENPSFMFTQRNWTVNTKYVTHPFSNGKKEEVFWEKQIDIIILALVTTWTFTPDKDEESKTITNIKVNNKVVFDNKTKLHGGKNSSNIRLIGLVYIEKAEMWVLASVMISKKGQAQNIMQIIKTISRNFCIPNKLRIRDLKITLQSGSKKTQITGAGGKSSPIYQLEMVSKPLDKMVFEDQAIARHQQDAIPKITSWINQLVNAL